MSMSVSMSMSLSLYMFRDLECGLSKDLNDGERGLRRATLVEARGDTDVQIVRYAGRKGRERTEQSSSLFPSGQLKTNSFIR